MADENIAIEALHLSSMEYCREYLIDEPEIIDISISVSVADLEIEKKRYEMTEPSDEPYVETLCIFRKIAEAMPLKRALLFHSSAISVDGNAYLFTAPSGTGKSTHTRLWREALKERAVMVNDDKPFLKFTDEGLFVYGNPWTGKEGLGQNMSAPVKGICYLVQAPENSLRRLSPDEAFPFLCTQVYMPESEDAGIETYEMIGEITENIPVYELKCTPDSRAFEEAFKMTK
ncbi:MAG: hypothetical protein Q4B67_02440 [Eubacteriales bacterium]|nr:hypothetical protein [Eubacteriales bacterium]